MNLKSPLSSLHDSESFIARHIGPDENDIQAMLAELEALRAAHLRQESGRVIGKQVLGGL